MTLNKVGSENIDRKEKKLSPPKVESSFFMSTSGNNQS